MGDFIDYTMHILGTGLINLPKYDWLKMKHSFLFLLWILHPFLALPIPLTKTRGLFLLAFKTPLPSPGDLLNMEK